MKDTLPILLHSLWAQVVQMLALAHLRPLWVGYALGAIFVFSFAAGIWGQFTGRVRFTLEPQFESLDSGAELHPKDDA